MGRALLVWAILYLTYFVGSERRIVHGTLFAVAAVCALVGTALITSGWASWYSAQNVVPFGVRVWVWIIIAAVPLVIAAFHGHKGLIPIAVAVAYVIALPWCARIWTRTYGSGPYQQRISGVEPNIFAHAVVALFAVFLCYWGVRIASRALVNLSIVYFGIAVAWFYFSDILDKVGRSLGLIGLGILFLVGGWILEKIRRKLMLHIDSARTGEGVRL